jgi:cytoskeletal protein RodZ
MNKITTIIIIIFLILLGGIGYYLYSNISVQQTTSETVFDEPKNFSPFPTSNPEVNASSSVSNNKSTPAQEKITPSKPIYNNQKFRIVTNGLTNPRIDPQYKNETSYKVDGKSLDATTDNYVTVPENTIPLGSRVYIVNDKASLDVWGVVGDIGPYGGISLHAAEQLGVWRNGMGLNIIPYDLKYTFFEK